MKPHKIDVLGLGTVAVDELIVAESYPPADSKVRVKNAERQLGGLTAIALIAAARLGARCSYAGVLGNDELSNYAIQELTREKIDLTFVKRRKNNPPVHSFVVVDAQKHTRNVFSYRAVEYRLPANWPPKELIQSSRVLFLDHSDVDGMLRAASMARTNGVDVVADLERVSGPRFSELVAQIDHLILSRGFAVKLTNKRTIPKMIHALWKPGKKLVAITDGAKGCWFVESSNPRKIQHQPAFKVDVVDTTGCGDVFHGAYAVAMAKGLDPIHRIRFASAAAAFQATKLGAQAGIPTLRELNQFLKRSR